MYFSKFLITYNTEEINHGNIPMWIIWQCHNNNSSSIIIETCGFDQGGIENLPDFSDSW